MDRSPALNRASWDDRAPLHAESPGYGVDALVADPGRLSGVVRFDDDSSYVPTSRPPAATHEWNHGLGEIVTALLDQGPTLTGLTEHGPSRGRRCPAGRPRTTRASGTWTAACPTCR
ncbi:hypothetical protein [Pseudonocardia sp. ICBG1293]|uniref:hypothetical protein n=1 Tax=Pseudonocardia sp. ICBG1293 TaxID=2844382 RepID=UPI001CCBC857|nr:hypothetical protein [Pseudonocardia sp. ICBG1293]